MPMGIALLPSQALLRSDNSRVKQPKLTIGRRSDAFSVSGHGDASA
jgi:hypothetical protein